MDVASFYQTLFEDTLGLDILGMTDRYTELVRLIDRKTLPAFSTYIPAKYRTYLDLNDKSCMVPKEHPTLGVEYNINDPMMIKFGLPINSLDKVEYNNLSKVDPYDPQAAAYYSSLIASRHNITLEGVLMGSEYTYNRTLIDSSVPFKKYKEVRGPRTIYLENYAYGGTVELVIGTRWPNIASIPEEYRETLMELAKYDIKIKLWNELRYLEDVKTPNGNLNLRISDWESADKERTDFLKELKTKSLADRVGPTYFHIL